MTTKSRFIKLLVCSFKKHHQRSLLIYLINFNVIGRNKSLNLLPTSRSTMLVVQVYNYFSNHYMSVLLETEKWAKSYWHFKHSDTDTNMFLERYMHVCTCTMYIILYCTSTLNVINSFHNKLETTYLPIWMERSTGGLITCWIPLSE